MVNTRNKDSRSNKQRIEEAKRIADDVERASNIAIIPNNETGVGQRALTNTTQILESSTLIPEEHALNGKRTITTSPMQHRRCKELYTESS